MITLRLLGAIDVQDATGRRAADLLRRPKRVALLAYLAAARPRGLHRRDHLLGLFWAEATQDHARRALNQALYVLRRELGKDTILTPGDAEVGLDHERAEPRHFGGGRREVPGDLERAVPQRRFELVAGEDRQVVQDADARAERRGEADADSRRVGSRYLDLLPANRQRRADGAVRLL